LGPSTIAKTLAGITRPSRLLDMRHDSASALSQDGAGLLVIAQLLGHTTTRMTARYAHLHPDTPRAAIAGLAGRGSASQQAPSLVDLGTTVEADKVN
jgi:integrase